MLSQGPAALAGAEYIIMTATMACGHPEASKLIVPASPAKERGHQPSHPPDTQLILLLPAAQIKLSLAGTPSTSSLG